jgi:Cu-Zn family superoxide dismutase
VGKCDPPGFTTAAGHFNPEGRKHGGRTVEGPHAGDLGNLPVGVEGNLKAEIPAPRVTLSTGKGSLFPPSGTALVIHDGLDDELTDPTGNSGNRIACGVITR